MRPDPVPEPAVVERVDVGDAAEADPTPSDCLPPAETPTARADLSPGWIAVTDRELLVYHPDREPPIGRTLRANVTGLAVRRAGGRRYLGHVPKALLYALGAFAIGLPLATVDLAGFVALPGGTPVDSFRPVVGTLGRAVNLLGAALAFAAALAVVAVVALVGYWLVSRDVVLVVERGGADPLECPATRATGRRAVRALGD